MSMRKGGWQMSAREDAKQVYQCYIDREVERILVGLNEVRVSLSNEEGQAGGLRLPPSAPATNSCSGAGLMNALPRNGEQRGLTAAGRFTAPEPHEPTKVFGWLLVGLFAYCAFVLGWAIA